MADLLYGCVGVDGRRKRKRREFRSVGFTIDGYTDEELRARYRFGKSIQYITDLLADNLRRKTNRNRPLTALQQVLIALRFNSTQVVASFKWWETPLVLTSRQCHEWWQMYPWHLSLDNKSMSSGQDDSKSWAV